jgi:hypothetical protein
LRDQLREGHSITFTNVTKKCAVKTVHELSARQVDILLVGGLTNWIKSGLRAGAVGH